MRFFPSFPQGVAFTTVLAFVFVALSAMCERDPQSVSKTRWYQTLIMVGTISTFFIMLTNLHDQMEDIDRNQRSVINGLARVNEVIYVEPYSLLKEFEPTVPYFTCQLAHSCNNNTTTTTLRNITDEKILCAKIIAIFKEFYEMAAMLTFDTDSNVRPLIYLAESDILLDRWNDIKHLYSDHFREFVDTLFDTARQNLSFDSKRHRVIAKTKTK